MLYCTIHNIKIYDKIKHYVPLSSIKKSLAACNLDQDYFLKELRRLAKFFTRCQSCYGLHGIVYEKFKIVAIYSKKKLFIISILPNNKDFNESEFKSQILDVLRTFHGEDFHDNLFTIVKILGEKVFVLIEDWKVTYLDNDRSCFRTLNFTNAS